MRYLFFDIECCDGRHICEFGYVITDEKFNLLTKEVFTINPDKPFNLAGREHERDMSLSFEEQVYKDSPLFPYYYGKIRELITYPDQIVIGHAIHNDAKFLRKAWWRYNKPPIDFNFVDSQKIYKELANEKRPISLEKAVEVLGVDKSDVSHRSDEDALLTMNVVKAMCAKHGKTLQEIIELCPNACGKVRKSEIILKGESLSDMLEAMDKNDSSLSNNKKGKCLMQFIEVVQPKGEMIKSRLNGKKLCFSRMYEKTQVKEVIKLIQLLANHGCKYNTKISENDYFVALPEDIENAEDEHSRYFAATHVDEGHSIEIITMDELYKILSITEEGLSSMAMPKAPKQKGNKKFKKKDKRHTDNKFTGNSPTSIGDILRYSGNSIKKASGN